MRTTLTINDALYERVVAFARDRKVPLKEAVAEVIGLGLAFLDRTAVEPYRHKITPHAGGPTRPELNYASVQEMLDYSEGEDRRW